MDFAIIFAMPLLLVGFGTFIIWLRRLDLAGDVGLRAPSLLPAVAWLIGFVLLAVAAEFASHSLGLSDPGGSWRGKYDGGALALRIIAVALVYPIAEEYFFRGALLGLVRRKFGDIPGILASSLLFAAAHLQYDWRGMAFILADALFFAICRVRTGSLPLVMLFHVLGNSFAVWQRLYG